MLLLFLLAAFQACISSDESGGSRQDPVVREPAAAQSGAPSAQQPNASGLPQQDGQKQKAQARGSKLTSKQDTVTASVTRSAKSPSRSSKNIKKPSNPAYTVQVGAFKKAQNALACQKRAKERFPRNSVHNNFDPGTKLYRVSVGKFTTRMEAVVLRREIMRKHSKDYAQAWVNYIAP